MRYKFKDSLLVGQAAESKFHELYPSLIRTDGRKEDFILPDGTTLDLKAESRTTEQTPNLAVELESSEGRPGAIQRAVNDGVTYITYVYADGAHYTYLATSLLEYLLDSKHRIVFVKNVGYTTKVMLIPRDAVKHLEIDVLKELL